MFEDFAEQVFCPIPRNTGDNNQVFSISSHLRQQAAGGESPAAKREGYSTLPSAKTIAKTIAGEHGHCCVGYSKFLFKFTGFVLKE